MGVTGLWPLISPVGKPVTLESLENKVLAVDVSIWLNQAVKGFRDGSGRTMAHAHLVSLCNRICKLLFYRIKPIFVFDGATPHLKKQTLIARERLRQKARRNIQASANQILTNYLAAHAVQGGSKKKTTARKRNPDSLRDDEDIFRLPPVALSKSFQGENSNDEEEEEEEDTVGTEDIFNSLSVESRLQDLSSVDIESSEFKSLPPDIRYEILSAMKENKRRNHGKVLPQDSQEFSNFQMLRLLERSRLQQGMELAAKELNQRQLGEVFMELCEGEMPHDTTTDTHRIVSEDSALSLLIHKAPKPKVEPVKDSSKTPSLLEDINEYIISGSEDDDDDIKSIQPMLDSSANNIINHTQSEVRSKEPTNSPTSSRNTEDPIAQWFIDVEKSTEDKTIYPQSSVSLQHESEISSRSIHARTNSPQLISNSKEIVTGEVVASSSQDNRTKSESSHTSVGKTDNKFENTINAFQNKKYEFGETSTDQSILGNQKENKASTETKHDKINDASLDEKDADLLPCVQGEQHIISLDKVKRDLITGTKGVSITVEIKPDQKPELDDLFLPETFQQVDQMTSKSEDVEILSQTKRLPNQDLTANDEVSEILVPISKELLSATSQEEALAVLDAEREQLLREKGRQQRQAQTLSDQIVIESQELLQLFGVPFVVSPMEAEAQCAALESLHLTHGTITDDSDIWLFGGQKVYRHFFHQDKYVQLYTKDDIHSHFGLDQEQLICFAMLTGSDYTEGVEGVGAVTAMEVLAEFKSQGLQTLLSLKSWWESHRQKKAPPGNAVRGKLLSIHLPDSFPREEVFQAYLNPEVDQSTEKFSWQAPDLCALRELLNGKLGMKMERVNDMILPVIKKFNQSQSQTRLDSFFTTSLKAEAVQPASKRLQKALQKFHPKEISKGITETRTKSKTEANARNIRGNRANRKATRGSRRKTPAERGESDSSDCDNPKVIKKKRSQCHSYLSESSSESSSEAQGSKLVANKGRK